MKVIRKLLAYLSSSNRQSTETIQRFTIQFPDDLVKVMGDEITQVSLVFFSVRNSFQPVNANNNSFTAIINNISYPIVIPIGAHSLQAIAANTAIALNAAQSTTVFTITCPNSETNYGAWSWTGIPTVQLLFNSGNAKDLLGFYSGLTTLISTSAICTTPICMFSGQEPYIQVHCNMPPQHIRWNSQAQQMDFSEY